MKAAAAQKEIKYMFLLMLAALIIRLGFFFIPKMAFGDEIYYVRMAQNLNQNGEFEAFNMNHNKGQPLLPLIFSMIYSWHRDPVIPCRFFSLMLAVLTLIPFHLCARRLCKAKEALWADVMYVFLPFAIRYSHWAMTEAAFIFSLLWALYFLMRLQYSTDLLWAFGAGVALGCAYLIRVEAFVLFLFLLVLGICSDWEQRPDRLGADHRYPAFLIFLFAFIIFALPYWIWLRWTSGIWQITWSTYGGATGYMLMHWNRFLEPEEFLFFKITCDYFKNISRFYYDIIPHIMPIMIWVPIMFGFLKMLQRRTVPKRNMALLLVFAFSPLLFYPAFVCDARFMYAAMIFFTLFSGTGMSLLLEKFLKWARSRGRLYGKAGRRIIAFLGVIFLAGNFMPGYAGIFIGFRDLPIEQKMAGEWIKKNFKEPKVILGVQGGICLYAGSTCGSFVNAHQLKAAVRNGDALEVFLKKREVDILVVDTRFFSQDWPPLDFLVRNDPPKFLRKLAEFSYQKEKIILYSFF